MQSTVSRSEGIVIAKIKDRVNKIWQPLNFLQTEILQLKHCPISVQMEMMSGITPTVLKTDMCALHKNSYNYSV